MKATDKSGRLEKLKLAQISIPVTRSGAANLGAVAGAFSGGSKLITLNILPEISDSKSAEYSDESIIGRSFPIKVYNHSGNRAIGMKCTFIVQEKADIQKNWENLRALQSAVYPGDSGKIIYLPPPICQIRVGYLFTAQNGGWIPVVLKTCSVNYKTDVVWDDQTYLPYFMEVDLQWEVVFANNQLPGQDKIFKDVP
jgi:hypothetical protein